MPKPVSDKLIIDQHETAIKRPEQPPGEWNTISNLAAPTSKNGLPGSGKALFNLVNNRVSDKSGSNYLPRKALTNTSGYPYREAHLVDYNGDISKAWHIVFYAWDIGKKKLVRKRVGKDHLAATIPPEKRKAKARELIDDLNLQLKTGGYLETLPKNVEVKAFDFHGYKLLNAIEYVERHKREIDRRSASTSKEINYTRNTLQAFMDLHNLDKNMLLRQVSPAFIQRYAMYLRETLNLSNKTYNDRINSLHNCFETLRKLDTDLWKNKNPVAKFEKLQVTSKTHAAYTTNQLATFVELIEPHDAQLLLFIRFIYYTLARGKELRYLKVGHIRMDHNKILMVGEHAKTDKEKYVGISKEFAEIIHKSGIMRYPADDYVFTILGTPGQHQTGKGYFRKRFSKYLKASGFKKLNPAYMLYSFKHSGAVQLYLATKDPYLVQLQCRHSDLSTTMKYLRDLGLFIDFSALAGWKGF